jgi:hypothetical protein
MTEGNITPKNLRQNLEMLSDPSTPPAKLKQRLGLLWYYVEANEDAVVEILNRNGLKILTDLFETTKSGELKVCFDDLYFFCL